MRTLAMLAAATLCLQYATPVFAQGQSGPQPGLPPGANVMAPNAGQPPSTGRSTTLTQPAAPMAAAPMDTTTPPVRHRRVVHHHVVHHRHVVHHVVTPAPAPAAQ